ncbi:hypothetical protein ACQ4WX_05130 [Streptomyces lasalocidi]
MVIAIDDAQHLDAFSQQWLVYLTRRAGAARLLIVLGWRDDIETTPANHRLLYTDLYPQAHCRRLELTALSPAGVTELLAERLDETAAVALAANVHAFTGGNPLLVRAFAGDTRAARRDSRDAPAVIPVAGDEVERAVLIVLHRCDPVTVRVAAGIAVIDDSSRPALVRLTGVAPDRVAAATDVLARIGLVNAGRMRHRAFATTVLNALSAAERAELHWRAVELLKANGADTLSIARHLLASGRLDDARAVPILVEGAEQALAERRVRRAIELLRLAYQVDGDERRRVRILASLLRAEWRVNPACSASHLPELTEAVLNGRLGGGDAVMTIMFLAIQGRVADAGAALSRVAATSLPGSRSTGEFEMLRIWLTVMYPGIFRGADTEAVETGSSATPAVSIGHRMLDHFKNTLGEWPTKESLVHADQVLRYQPLNDVSLLPLVLALHTLLHAGRLDEAEQRCQALMQSCLTEQAPTRHAWFCGVAAEIALHRGSLDAAETHAFTALELVPVAEWGCSRASR